MKYISFSIVVEKLTAEDFLVCSCGKNEMNKRRQI
jgi:hypothetical protein